MNQLFESRAVHTFNLLSIGQRGADKTVFLASSYKVLGFSFPFRLGGYNTFLGL
jgi:hypothetical protein